MADILTPKPNAEKKFIEVNLVYDRPEWTWRVPTRFPFGVRAKFDNVPYSRCFDWLRSELNKTIPAPSSNGSAIVKRPTEGIEKFLADTAKTISIPDESMVERYIKRFYRQYDVETLKQQLDIICKPLEGTPLASAVVESGEADESVVESIFDFLFATVYMPEPSPISSGQEESSSLEISPLKESISE